MASSSTPSQTHPTSSQLETQADPNDDQTRVVEEQGSDDQSVISSTQSSLVGEDVGGIPQAEEWGPQHPCFPHLNPHVARESSEFQKTRIIRIQRNYLVRGDLAPAFSNLYPEILDPAGLPEAEFRRILETINSKLISLYSPYNWRNILDGAVGLFTGWIWDDLGQTHIKGRLQDLEDWIENWNRETARIYLPDSDREQVSLSLPPKIISLRQTGYMTLDIQIPDPEIAPIIQQASSVRSS